MCLACGGEQIESLDRVVGELERRIQAVFTPTPAIQRLPTLPGVGRKLAVVIALKAGEVTRFATAEKLASYAGTTPRVHASGGKTRFGPSRPDVNRYLKWAYVEAANAICLTRGRTTPRHVSRRSRPEEHGAEEGPETHYENHRGPRHPAWRLSRDSTGSGVEAVKEV